MRLAFSTATTTTLISTLTAFWAAATLPTAATAGSEPFVGEIMIVGYNFCPRGWTEANGQLLPINSNSALFSLYGTTYGGDGRTNFALPDLRGRVAIHQGTGEDLSERRLGRSGGREQTQLGVRNLPRHSHRIKSTNQEGTSPQPGNKILARDIGTMTYHSGPPTNSLAGTAITPAGRSQPVGNMPPYLVMRFCVALQGVFPSRN